MAGDALKATMPPHKCQQKRGRKSLLERRLPLLRQMAKLLAAGRCGTPHAAAKLVAKSVVRGRVSTSNDALCKALRRDWAAHGARLLDEAKRGGDPQPGRGFGGPQTIAEFFTAAARWNELLRNELLKTPRAFAELQAAATHWDKQTRVFRELDKQMKAFFR